jgi:hypothetical protein
MKKISLLVVLASIGLAISTASAQTLDTTKNKVEIKKKTTVGANGKQETKIKMETKGTPEAVTGAVESAVTGRARAATPATPATPATATTPAIPATPAQPAQPSVIVVQPERAKAETVTKVVTVPVPVKAPVTTTKTTTTTTRAVKPATRKTTTTRKPVAATSTTTTTTTVKKEE